MRFYLDSNVYSFLQATGELNAARRLLRGSKVVVTEPHLIEATRIPDYGQRVGRFRMIAGLHPHRLFPGALLDAYEVWNAAQVLRPEWINRNPDATAALGWLYVTAEAWQTIHSNPGYPANLEGSMGRWEDGVATRLARNKRVRYANREHPKGRTATTEELRSSPTIDDYWRGECALVWKQALLLRDPLMSDYADYLSPFLNLDAIDWSEDWAAFWHTVDPQDVPRNRVQSLTAFYQPMFKVSAGDALDEAHSVSLIMADVVVTCDRTFHDVLSLVSQHFATHGRLVLLDRGAPSVCAQLKDAIAM